MQYLHDVWVNWFEGEENGYNVCEFHEWRKYDGIEILDQVPITYVDSKLFQQIENDLTDLPDMLLKKIRNASYLRKNQDRIPIEYATIVTNGQSALAIDTMGYQIPIRKSRLIPRQERLVFEAVKSYKSYQFVLENNNYEKTYHILSLPPKAMIGLTRRERHLKQLLMMVLDQLKQTKNTQEVHYWLTEWMPNEYQSIQKLTSFEAWNKLYTSLVEGWSKQHELICKKMVKGQPFFEQLWELEQNMRNKHKYKRIL
ncbi:DUF3603 family protein [Paraliobacillus salinarum]|uniref:DUF3603 family protein n=1 Tax=Paraliobacillus salinarum TaxID=1158996 RepID=UPI0015F6570A|nr:DUF3603 family protein [Paraliobacillus salinarum]